MKKENTTKKRGNKKENKQKYFIFCFNHHDKMEGMISCSSSTTNNDFCNKMRLIEGSVCSKCYVIGMNKRFKSTGFVDKYNNDFLLKNTIANDNEIPFLNVAYFRVEAFGELETVIQAINYLKLIQKNKHVNFAWWTKRPEIVKKALEIMEIKPPKNCNFILSSVLFNLPDTQILERYRFLNGLFTVYSKYWISENTININCGGKKCIDCLNCYKKHKSIFYVNELEK